MEGDRWALGRIGIGSKGCEAQQCQDDKGRPDLKGNPAARASTGRARIFVGRDAQSRPMTVRPLLSSSDRIPPGIDMINSSFQACRDGPDIGPFSDSKIFRWDRLGLTD